LGKKNNKKEKKKKKKKVQEGGRLRIVGKGGTISCIGPEREVESARGKKRRSNISGAKQEVPAGDKGSQEGVESVLRMKSA